MAERTVSHLPVLVDEVLRFLAPERGGWFVDCTVGLGGHAAEVLRRHPVASVLGIDRDTEALEHASDRLREFGPRARLVHGNFGSVREIVAAADVGRPAGILADLGVSSLQLDRPERGFSFMRSGPLDMRMDQSPGSATRTARDVVNLESQSVLETVLRDYGEERQARRIARAIVERRRRQPIETTDDLRDLVHEAVGASRVRRGRALRAGARSIDAATRTFQALRIAVNEELSGLGATLEQAMKLLERDGRLVVISYHSLEDRIVKHRLRASALGEKDPITGRPRAETRLIELMTRKPIRPEPSEVQYNPRSRSARLRAARRL
ncbi:MAG: 16S rRNA (cytosine(1402)-N(4))-methyltransferase RsmH [Acidobacteria bacterium]|nr:16S rRNA (cytosine(1402)-N(4))-methyltransferase RsmH [Acidobacteriota bacterium]